MHHPEVRESTEGDTAEAALTAGREAFLGYLMKRLKNCADAEDVLQDFCLRVLAHKGQLRVTERLDAWLYAILRSALNDHFRKRGRRERLSAAILREGAEPELAPDAAEAMGQVCSCIEGLIPQLGPAQAELIRRIDLEEADRAQVARDLGLSPGTLAVRLHRARAALRDRLLAHCGCCCEHGFEDCACPPAARAVAGGGRQ